jgi:hypothetical protein
MNEEREPLRAVSWRDLCPWLILFRVFRHAVSLPALLLATVAVLLTPVGWRVSERLFLRDDNSVIAEFASYPRDPGNLHRWPLAPGEVAAGWELRRFGPIRHAYGRAAGEIASVYHGLVEPFRRLFYFGWSLAEFAFFLLGALWTLAVWSVAGGAITRLAVVPLAADQPAGLQASLGHALRKFPAYFLAPLFPLLGVACIGAMLALFGLLLRAGGIGVLAVGVLWFLVILGGFLMAYILLGLLFGWPLMWVAASAEPEADFFEAVSRGYSYARQAPLRYLFYALIAVLFGGLCWLLVQLFTEAVLALGEWGVAWGAGREQVGELRNALHAIRAGESFEPISESLRIGVWLIAAWTGLVYAVATAFAYSFFWCSAAAIYLLLRYDVDHREMDEVWIPDQR